MHHLMYDNIALDRAVANKIYQSDVSVIVSLRLTYAPFKLAHDIG